VAEITRQSFAATKPPSCTAWHCKTCVRCYWLAPGLMRAHTQITQRYDRSLSALLASGLGASSREQGVNFSHPCGRIGHRRRLARAHISELWRLKLNSPKRGSSNLGTTSAVLSFAAGLMVAATILVMTSVVSLFDVGRRSDHAFMAHAAGIMTSMKSHYQKGMQDGNMMRASIRISWFLFAVCALAYSSVRVLRISLSAPHMLDSGTPCNKIDGGFERKPARRLASKIATYKFFTPTPQGDILCPMSTCAKRLPLTIRHVQFVYPNLILFS
jgi:hypothetical protein